MLVTVIQFLVFSWGIEPEMFILTINFLECFLSTEIKLPFCLQAKKICEVGLEVGSSSISCLGDPSRGKW